MKNNKLIKNNQDARDIYKFLLKTIIDKNVLNLLMPIIGALILLVAIIASLWLIQQSIDFVFGNGNITFQFLVMAAGLCVYYFRTNFTVQAVKQYREYAAHIILSKDIYDLKRNNTSLYLSALTNDVNIIKENFLDQMPIIIQILICAAGAIALMFYYNPLLTIIAMVISLVPTLASMKSGEELAEADVRLSDENAGYMAKLSDVLSGFGVIKSCRASDSMRHTLSSQNMRLKDKLLMREKTLEKINYYAAVSGYITLFGVIIACVYFAVFKKVFPQELSWLLRG